MSETDDSEEDVAILSKERMSTKDLVVKEPKENDVSRVVNNKLWNTTKSLNNLALSSECSLDGCAFGKNKYMLECSKCKKLTHYACTKLPNYQIALFIQKNYRLYVCSTCRGNTH